MSLGPTELLIVLGIVLLLFGAAKLPKLARSVGESAKEFKSATATIDSVNEPLDTKPQGPARPEEPTSPRPAGGYGA
jgi:sec-independent protein translocase protein TatA